MDVLIIEDEPLAANRLQELLEECHSEINVVAKCISVEKTVEWLNTHKHPELIFSDIQIADGLSFEVFKQVEVQSPVIFTTAFDQYAIEAFEVNSVDYLLKPIKLQKLLQSLAKFEQLKKKFASSTLQEKLTELTELVKGVKTSKSRFLVKSGQKIKAIKIEQIAYFYSQDKLTMLMTHEGQKFPIDYSLDELVGMLKPKDFFKLNRKIIANIDATHTIHPHFKGRLKVELEPSFEEEVIISAERTPLFKIWLNQ